MARKSAYESGMRGSEKPKEGKVRGVHINKVENGHSVSVDHEQHAMDSGFVPPKERVFQEGNEDEMVSHVLKSLGVKQTKESGESNPASDNNQDENKCNGKCPHCC